MTGLRCPRHAATCMTSFGFETTITLAPKTFKSTHFQHLPSNDSTTPKPKRLQLKYNFHKNTPYIHPSQPKMTMSLLKHHENSTLVAHFTKRIRWAGPSPSAPWTSGRKTFWRRLLRGYFPSKNLRERQRDASQGR